MDTCSLRSVRIILSTIVIGVLHCGMSTCSSLRFGGPHVDDDLLKILNRFGEFESRPNDVVQSEIAQFRMELEKIGLKDISKINDKVFATPSPLDLDPDATRDVVQLIVSQGYPAQEYTVQTKDGFLLGLQRIPFGKDEMASGTFNSNKTRPPVFLQHGLISSAADWVMNFPNDSLAFILADNGYDVWLGNSRGNTYSSRHVSLHHDQEKFWDWTFDEMAKYDVTAFIDFILEKTGESSLYYVGHSQGTIMAFASFSSFPEYRDKIRLFVGLAPIISLNHMESKLKYLSILSDRLDYAILGRKTFLQNNILVKFIADTFCDESVTNLICSNVIFIISGYDTSNLNLTRLAVYISHTPAGTSVKNLVHYAQFVRSKKFAMYDYDSPSKNMKHYGQKTPPLYNPSQFHVPALLISGSDDSLADPADVKTLEDTIPNIVGKYHIPGWNHVDFVWGLDAGERCYKDIILKWLKKY